MSDPRGLGWQREANPPLYDHYAKKLPYRGWAGRRSPEEKEYIKKVKQARKNGSIRQNSSQ